MTEDARLVPVSVITGFLGSGKTSFIRRVLTEPGFGRTAVIVNEFGEISLDHELITSSDDSVLTLSTGCLCCAVQTDLARTLLDLEARRIRGEATFDRILIETSGLANPGSMLQSMMTDPQVAGGHRIDTVLTIADAVHGEHTLADHVEARMQVALADVILMSKLDVTPMSSTLHAAIQGLNQRAPVLPVRDAAIGTLFGRAPAERPGLVSERVNRGHSDVQTFTLMRDRPIPALALTLLLQAIAEHCGSRLLRLKGLVGIEEMPGQPAVIHGVHHVMSAPEFLDRWPTADETTRVVFIGMDIPRYFIPRLLDAIEDEVRSTTVL